MAGVYSLIYKFFFIDKKFITYNYVIENIENE